MAKWTPLLRVEIDNEYAHANALVDLLKYPPVSKYTREECMRLLELVARVVSTSYLEQELAISELEEFLR